MGNLGNGPAADDLRKAVFAGDGAFTAIAGAWSAYRDAVLWVANQAERYNGVPCGVSSDALGFAVERFIDQVKHTEAALKKVGAK